MFKDNLAALRKLHGFSQDELADRIGITRQTCPSMRQEVPLVKDTTPRPTLTQYFTQTIYG